MTGRFSVLEVSVPYRLQRERAAPHPAEVQARPLAPDRPASVLGQVVDELQRTAGNGQSESLAHYTPTHPNGAEQVPTMVGVEGKAWLRMAGSDQPVRFVDFKASVDPVSRQVTVLRNEIGGGRVPAAR
jgi:hypothetical protein